MANVMVAPATARPALAPAKAPEAAFAIRFVCTPLISGKANCGRWKEGLLSCATNGISRSGGLVAQHRCKLICRISLFSNHSEARRHCLAPVIRVAADGRETPICSSRQGAVEAREELEYAQAEASAVGPDNGSTKVCPRCGHAKLLCDFEMRKYVELHKDECRACSAALRAKKSGAKNHQLTLSVEEAWERARKCSRCGLVKELRDFGSDISRKDGFNLRCRGCVALYCKTYPAKAPADTPQCCNRCGKVKPPDDFASCKRARSGLHPTCKICCSDHNRLEYVKRKKSGVLVQPMMKRCRVCQLRKPPAEMKKVPGAVDGLDSLCKACDSVRSKRQWRARKEGTALKATPSES